MERGYVKLWRKSIDSGILKNHKLWAFWTWCLIKATHKPIKQMVGFQKIDLEPGQFIFGINASAKETGLSPQSVRTCLSVLEKMQNLTRKTTNKFSIITIINWDTYQPEKHQANNQINNQVTINQQSTNNKQEHKEHKNKNIYTSDFEFFWAEYPNRKCGKANTFKSWQKLNGTRPPINTLLEIIKKHKQSHEWQKNNGQFIPMATTWLNQNRWDAEVENPEQKTKWAY